jgi:hypothetical protein
MIEIIVNIVVYGTALIFGGVVWFLIAFSKAYASKK